jgi:hypothetical protein
LLNDTVVAVPTSVALPDPVTVALVPFGAAFAPLNVSVLLPV